jgi:hypothetical protein
MRAKQWEHHMSTVVMAFWDMDDHLRYPVGKVQ